MNHEKQAGKKHGKLRKAIRIGVVAVLAAWLAPLLIPLNFWRQEVGAALSRSLRRPVEVGELHLEILGGFGFRLSRIAVGEHPAFGPEPFARAESLTARLALSSLWHGRLEFSSLELDSPSINVVRNAAGQWNLTLLGAATDSRKESSAFSGAERAAASVLPRVRLTAGRINFKAGERKKVYWIDLQEMDLVPPESPWQPWRFRLEAMPSRSDIPFRSTSPLLASGEIGPWIAGLPPDAGIPLHLDWRAENAMLAELLTVLTGSDYGLHGRVMLQGHAAGSTALFRVEADGQVHDLHRWDLHPWPETSPLEARLAAIVDLSSESVELTSLNLPLGSGKVELRGRIADLFSHPRPRLELELREVSLSRLAAFLPQFTTRIRPGFRAEGTLQGRLWTDGFAEGVFGKLEVAPGSLRISETAPELAFSGFPVFLEGNKGRLGPVLARAASVAPLQVSLQWDRREKTALWQLRGEGIPLPVVQRLSAAWGIASNWARLQEGTLALHLDLATRPGAPPRLAGWTHVSDAVIESAAINQPVRVPEARFHFEPNRVIVQPASLSAGPLTVSGTIAVSFPAATFRRESSAAPLAVEYALESGPLDLAELTALVAPRKREAFFFGFGSPDSPLPTPLDLRLAALSKSAAAHGTWRFESIRLGGTEWSDVQAAGRWREGRLELTQFSAHHAGGIGQGSGVISFAPRSVALELSLLHTGIDLSWLLAESERWRGAVSGTLQGRVQLSGSGATVAEMLAHLRGSGEVSGSRIVLRDSAVAQALGLGGAAEVRLASLAGSFRISDRRIHIADLRMVAAGRRRRLPARSWTVSGEVGFDQRLDLLVEPDSGGDKSRWAGTLAAPRRVDALGDTASAPSVLRRGRGASLASE
ncbi:MAG TPA: AsmA family protein [Terriglobia bacterium]|nr:AsmA family protein [Terriglobia bacterium]